MKFIPIHNQTPTHQEWYLVKCPEYSPSGFQIACWDDHIETWIDDLGSSKIDQYIIAYHPKPLNNHLS